MLDPLSALGLASAIVSFVDFGCKLISDGYTFYGKGSLGGVGELEMVTEDLIRLANDLTTNPPQSTKHLTAEDSGLQQLAASCRTLADQLLHVLSSLQPRKPHDGILAFRSALRKARKKGAIDNLEKRLEKIQNQLNIRLVAMLSNKQSEEARQNNTEIADKLDSIRWEVLTAVQKQQKRSRGPRALVTADGEENIVISCRHLAGKAKWVAGTQKILKSLHYQHIKEREANVKDAQLHTFEWIFDDISSRIGARTRFVEWMKSGNGIYWISGKAGSGKSTLVKYVQNHAHTLQALSDWAGSSKLVLASHFFWSAGNKMQTSQIGLLQSLLYQVLRQCPFLTEALCSTRWSTIDDGLYEDNPKPWSLRELSGAFEALADYDHWQASQQPTKFCFFVDGLDEYDGEHADILRILQSFTRNLNIKICVSSRPWNVFEKAFGGSCDKLLLQEFTSTDIKIYVKAKLEADEGFLAVIKEDIRYQQLIEDIVAKAQGVFLWVFLVVRSLLRGLADENDFTILQKRLDQLPSDLEEYFFHILDTVEPIYQEHTAQIFHLTLHSKRPLSAITLFFLEQEKTDPEYAQKLELHSIQETDVLLISQRMKKHVNACCKDLLEVNIHRSEDSFLQYKIDFLHRTVRDFLMTKDMIELLKRRTSPHFDPHISLCRVLLSQIKTYPLTMVKSSKNQTLMLMIHEFLQYVYEVETRSGISQNAILDELDRVLSITAINRAKVGPFPASYRGLLRDYNFSSLLSLCVEHNLKQYVSSKLECQPTLIQSQNGRKPLLYHALHLNRDDELWIWDSDLEMVKLLLQHGADPNEKGKGDRISVWRYYLIMCVERRSKSSYRTRQAEAFLVTETLIRHGADVDIQIETNNYGPKRVAFTEIFKDDTVYPIKQCEPQYKSLQEILGETFPREAYRIPKLLAENRRSWFRRWFW